MTDTCVNERLSLEGLCGQPLGDPNPPYENRLDLTKFNPVRQITHGPCNEGGTLENADLIAQLEKVLDEGRTYQVAQEYGQAEQSYLQGLDLARAHFGSESLQMAKVFNLLVAVYSIDKKRHREAKILCKQVIAMGMNGTFAPNHEVVITAMNNLAVLHIEHGAYRQAETLLKQVHEAWLEQKGPEHTLTRRAMRNLVEFYRRSGKVEPAMHLLGQALTLVLPNLRGSHIPTSYKLPNSNDTENEGAQS